MSTRIPERRTGSVALALICADAAAERLAGQRLGLTAGGGTAAFTIAPGATGEIRL